MTATLHPWADPASLAELHTCRTQDELEREFAKGLRELFPVSDAAVRLCDETRDGGMVHIAIGETCPATVGVRLAEAAWLVPSEQRISIHYRDHNLGEFLTGSPMTAEQQEIVKVALAHFGTALVNLALNQEARQATDNYCASLAALEEGIVLFQEESPPAVMARLLSLAASMVQATAGALYVLREVGDASSGLCLEQVLGMPESLLGSFSGVDGSRWPDVLLGQPPQFAARDASGALGMLAPECVPSILQSLVVLPLRYHGVEAGVCLLFNPATETAMSRDLLGRVQSLGQLGAALLHRLRLEAVSAANSTIEKELEIAETIQKRLLPTRPPYTEDYEFAWDAVTAKNIGGDYLDIVRSDIGDVYAIVADAAGHGINSALLMSSFRSTYRGNAPWLEPNELAASLNRHVVHEVGPTGMFITAAFLRIERDTRRLTTCSAGHCPTLVYRAATGSVERIDTDGPPLGFIDEATYTSTESRLEPGDVVLFYTDGVTEATNADLDMYGDERLVSVLRENGPRGAEAVVAAVRATLAAFTGRDRHDDDVSLMAIRAR